MIPAPDAFLVFSVETPGVLEQRGRHGITVGPVPILTLGNDELNETIVKLLNLRVLFK